MKNAEYWRGRFSLIEDAAQNEANRCISSLEDIYRDAERSVQADLEKWYGRFATTNGISLTEARKMLTTGQLEEFHWTVDQYIKAAQAGNLDPAWIKKLENASAKFHVSRLESIQLQIQQQLEILYGNQVDSIDDLLKRIISNGYTKSAYEIQKGIGLGWDITALDQKHLETLLSKPWTADKKTFRDRCWENQANLVNGIQTRLTQSLLRGDKLTRTRDEISRQFKVSKYKAGRLVHTETTYFNAIAAKETYADLGVDRVEIIETLDSHTCELCQPLDGTIIPMSQFEPGVTVPPFHPNCRGTTAPAIDPGIIGERAARNEDGEPTYYVPSNMSYADWKDTFVNGGSKSGLTPATAPSTGNATPLGGQSLDGYTPDQQKQISDMLDQAPPEIKQFYQKYQGQLLPVDEKITARHKAYFDPSDEKVHFKRNYAVSGSTYQPPYEVHFHEYGHNLDYIAGGGKNGNYLSLKYRDSNGRTFADIIDSEWEDAMKEYYRTHLDDVYMKYLEKQFNVGGMGGEAYIQSNITAWRRLSGLSRTDPVFVALKDEFAALPGDEYSFRQFFMKHFDKFGDIVYNVSDVVPEFCDYINATYSLIERSDLSDMFERFSIRHGGKDYPFGIGHGKKYSKDKDSLMLETFAEMISATISSPDSLSLIKRYLPKSYKAFIEMLKGVI